MDIRSLDDGVSELRDGKGSEINDINDGENVAVVALSDSSSDESEQSQLESHNSSFQLSKWRRLRKDYKDQYLDVFRTAQADESEDSQIDLESSQIGVVIWTADEKLKVFQSIARLGKHNLPGIVTCVETKSQLEVKDYIDHVEQEIVDRQLFEEKASDVSHADIPAATEIGPQCEILLERAADALAAFQDQYDYAVEEQRGESPWLVDKNVAKEIDEKIDEAETRLSPDGESESDNETSVNEIFQLFKLSKFLELSEHIFMNNGLDGLQPNWRDIVEDGERPSMTSEYIGQIYDILQNLLRRLMQTCIFVAQSRIRARTRVDYRPSAEIRKEDVKAAFDVLNMVENSWEYWLKLPRRRGLRVVLGSHRRGASDKGALDYNQVEAVLSERYSRGRQQSLSVTSSAPSLNGESPDDRNEVELFDDDSVSSYRPDESEILVDQDDEVPVSVLSSDIDDMEQGLARTQPDTPLLRTKQQFHPEDEQDTYLETIDQAARLQEEARLLEQLGYETQSATHEAHQPGSSPEFLGSSRDDDRGWTGRYIAEWEQFGATMPNWSAVELSPQRKKPKLSDAFVNNEHSR